MIRPHLHRLQSMTDLSLEAMADWRVKGLIFDLDDTLIPEHTGQFTEETLALLEHLTANHIKLGILTNNFSDSYLETVINQLRQRPISLCLISNA